MQKLIARYKDSLSAEDAAKIRKHAKKHPMSVCFLMGDELQTYRAALVH